MKKVVASGTETRDNSLTDTLEFRQHSGTVDANKIINWVQITRAVIERAAVDRKVAFKSNSASRTIRWMRETVGLELNAYIKNRMETFAQ